MTCDVRLGPADLSRLMPLHLVVDADGLILSAGPTLARMRAPRPVKGARFFDLFALRRPHGVATMAELAASGGDRLALEFRAAPRTQLKGHFVTDWHGLFLFDLGFGIKVNEVVSAYGLKATDFAPTSLAVEILYLVEANAAVAAETRQLNSRLQQAKAAAERLARTDDLTGLRNRHGMKAAIADMVAKGVPFSLLHVDLDFFKAVNDSLGHAAGDQVLVRVARILEGETRECDLVIRLGGDEFVLVYRDLIDRTRLAAIAGRIITALDAPIEVEGAACRVSASIGITTSELYQRPDPARMLRDADLALYRSKKAGRSRFTFHDPDGADRAGSGSGQAPADFSAGTGSATFSARMVAGPPRSSRK
jgi:diguanylate cyclase (GGDEF)-like protein